MREYFTNIMSMTYKYAERKTLLTNCSTDCISTLRTLKQFQRKIPKDYCIPKLSEKTIPFRLSQQSLVFIGVLNWLMLVLVNYI